MSSEPGAEPTVALVGDGPAMDAIRSALGDVDVVLRSGGPSELEAADFALVVAASGSSTLPEANRIACERGLNWIAVEVGGFGGAETEGSGTVAAFASDGPCYTCLRRRVERTGSERVSNPQANRSEVRYAGALAGRLAVAWLGGEDTRGRVVELPDTKRELLPSPHCQRCTGPHDWSLSLAYQDRPLEEAAQRAERAVDDRLGPVTVVGERESFPAPYYLAQFLPGRTDHRASTTQAAGVAAGWDGAYMKALGEAMERYSAGSYRDSWFVTSPAAAVSEPVTHAEFVLPEDAELPSQTESIKWVPGKALRSGTAVHLPADRTVFPPPGDGVAGPITTGLGLGSSTVDAVLAGLTEVIEREATMCAWYSTYEPVGLTVSDEEFTALERRAGSEGLSVTATLVTGDVDVPVVAATVTRDAWPRFAAGSAAGLDPNRAARSALAEALQNWMELRALGQADAAEAGQAVARYAEDPEQASELIEPAPTLPAADVGPEDPPTGQQALEALLERVGAVGLEAYAARLTARDVAEIGFEAVRVLVPEAQPLFVSTPVFGDRARSVPHALGYEPRLDRAFHPYP
jgi:ribosomal protein S12 methylthiotransferase accessory factor